MRPLTRFRPLLVLVAVFLMLSQLIGTAGSAPQSSAVQRATLRPLAAGDDETPRYNPKKESDENGGGEGEREGDPLERDYAFYSRRTAGDTPLTVGQAAILRAQAAEAAWAKRGFPQPHAFGSWSPLGPNPIVQQVRGDGALAGMSGRIGALAIRSTPPYTM